MCSSDLGVSMGYRPSHEKHPCTIWVGASLANFTWTVQHGLALCEEYSKRFHRVHGAKVVIYSISEAMGDLRFPEVRRTPFAQAMPDIYKQDDPVKAYRAYYLGDKRAFARWRNGRIPPNWWREALRKERENAESIGGRGDDSPGGHADLLSSEAGGVES